MRGLAFGVLAIVAVAAAAEPVLHGDGVNDDTDAIQAMIDAGKGVVKLPQPTKHYLISRTLVFRDNTGLELGPGTRILLAPGSSCPLAANADTNGNHSISLIGGIWDMDNLHQLPNPGWRHAVVPPLPPVAIPTCYERDFYRGNAFYFENVSNLVFRGATIRNPVTYGFQMCRVSFFNIENITLDYTTCNPIFGNMDGIHLDGGCRNGRISGVRGSAGDDLVALNANDVNCAAHQEPIRDIEIEDLQSDFAHSAVRILSAPAPVERIRISHVRGHYYVYAVGFTHYFAARHERGLIKDVVLRDIDVSMTAIRHDKWTARTRGPIFIDTDLCLENVLLDGVRLSPGVRVSERFGYDPREAGRHLQAALDSGLPRIIVDKQDGPWLVARPLVGRSNQEVVFEPGVEVRSTAGASSLDYSDCTNVTLTGGGTLGLSLCLRASENVSVVGLKITGTGADGIAILPSCDGERPCRNISLTGVSCEGCVRQGAFVSAVEGLKMFGCEFRGNGARGVDLDLVRPARGTGSVDILLENCDFEDNVVGDYDLRVANGFRAPSGAVAFWNVRTTDAAGRVHKLAFMRTFDEQEDHSK